MEVKRFGSLHSDAGRRTALIVLIAVSAIALRASGADGDTSSPRSITPFSQLSGLSGAGVQRIAVDPRDASRIYIDAQGGRIARTANGGSHWDVVQVASTSEYFRAIAVDPADPSIVLAFSTSDFASGAVYESRDWGAHWQRLPNQPSGALGQARIGRGIAIDQSGQTIVLSDRRQGIFWSPDLGRTWTNPLPGSQAQTFPLVSDPNDSATLWTGGFDPTDGFVAATWVSHDFGRTWSKGRSPFSIRATLPTPSACSRRQVCCSSAWWT
jgi:hypothetical protein